MSRFNKKVLSFILLGTFAAGTAFSVSAAAAGDLNNDSRIDGNDVRLLMSSLVGKGTYSGNADMNGDGIVNIADLCMIKSVALGETQQPSQTEQNNNGSIKDYGTQMDSSADLVADFRKGATPAFFASDGWENGDPFDCGWYASNTSLDNGMLTLKIDKDYSGKYRYSGAEYRTTDFYSYGYYETSMQAIKNDGVVSSFFTYTGPSDDNPWDEIDIEVLGKDTTKVQFNYYTNGQGNHEFMYDLGFDASEGFHTYGFDWQPDKITWYVDGKAVYTANQNIPKTPGKIMMNAWPGRGVDEWLKAFNGNTPLTARYQWVTYKKSASSNNNNQQQNPPANNDPWNQWNPPANNDNNPNQQPSNGSIADLGTQMDSSADLVADFRKGATPAFFASDGWENGDPFDCGWYASNTSLDNGMLSLKIDKDYSGKYRYSGAEYRTTDFYSYGYYETSMQAIKNDGVVSSFFTYTGPSDDNPWDEIDIEVLGKDTTKVQFNYYTNGQGNHEFMYDLGFDASEAFHTYGFDWQPDKITWYIDGKAVYTANQNIPKTPGKIMMNAWPGRGVDEWLKAFNGNTPLTARYQWVTYKKSASSNNNNQQQNPPANNDPWNQWNPPANNDPWNQWNPPANNNTPAPSGTTNGITTMNSNATLVADFTKGATPSFIASDGWTNGDPFDCGWYEKNTSLSGGELSLTIDKDYSGKYSYSAAEYRTNDFYGFGYYETSMKAIKNDGVVSSFFTYTGPSDNNPWDEIDIEILGKDTTKVQFNYYTNGVANHEFMYDLGFDSSQGFHTYGFDWQPDHITWYVDGKAVYTAYADIPKTPGKIMMNVWPGKGVDDWLKAFNGRTPLTAKYQWVTYNKQ